MRYIVNSTNHVVAVSFGSEVVYNDCACTEYTGKVPSGYSTLEDWHASEGEKLWRWKITGGNLTLDSSAVAPEEGDWSSSSDAVTFTAVSDGTRYLKFAESDCKLPFSETMVLPVEIEVMRDVMPYDTELTNLNAFLFGVWRDITVASKNFTSSAYPYCYCTSNCVYAYVFSGDVRGDINTNVTDGKLDSPHYNHLTNTNNSGKWELDIMVDEPAGTTFTVKFRYPKK